MSTPARPGSVDWLLSNVVAGGYCIGCGNCAAVPGSPLRMTLDDTGFYRPELDPAVGSGSNLPVGPCPFGGQGPDEDWLAERLFPEARHADGRVGRFIACYAGKVVESTFCQHGSSGGMAKWVLVELMRTGEVDHVIQVVEAEPASAGVLFQYAVASDVDEVRNGARAAYYPVEMSAVLDHIRAVPGRYAITGVPCFVKAIRLLSLKDPIMNERVRYTVGIICGHLKSARYADMLAWQLGIPPGRLEAIDFRAKLPGRTAKEKGVRVTGASASGTPLNAEDTVQNLFGTVYPHGMFKYSACDYCDDVLAETADVSVGDAWLPEYISSGNSIVVVRNRVVADMIEAARGVGRLQLDQVSADTAAASQAGGLRHRREGLAYRLQQKAATGQWFPPKRVEPSTHGIPLRRKLIYRLRTAIAARSVWAFEDAVRRQSWEAFARSMAAPVRLYSTLDFSPRRLLRRVGVARAMWELVKSRRSSMQQRP